MIKGKIILKCVALLCAGIFISNVLLVRAQDIVVQSDESQEVILQKTDGLNGGEGSIQTESENNEKQEDVELVDSQEDLQQDESADILPEDPAIDLEEGEEYVEREHQNIEQQAPVESEPVVSDQEGEKEELENNLIDSSDQELVSETYEEVIAESRFVEKGIAASETPEQRYIKRLYQVLLERNPDASGLKALTDALEQKSGTACSTAWAIVYSSEFNGKKYKDQTYVEKLYSALLGRKAGSAEVTGWINMMKEGVSRHYVLVQIVNSPEFANVCNNYGITKGSLQVSENRDRNYKVTAYVSRCYKYILGRSADVQGLNIWTGRILDGGSGAEIIEGFVFSREFVEMKKNDREFVDIMYQTMLGRSADVAGRVNWLDCLQRGVSYQYIINGFSESLEFKKICSDYGIASGKAKIVEERDRNIGVTGFVTRNYKVVLDRRPDVAGLNIWCNLINNKTQSPAQVCFGFVFSSESLKKKLNNADFVELLYQTCLGRPSDQIGKQDWVDRLNLGDTRENVFWGFANSLEFNKMIAEFGLTGAVYEMVELISCSAISFTGSQLQVSIHAKRSSRMEGLASSLYMVLLNSKGDKIVSSKKMSSSFRGDWVLNAMFDSFDSFRTASVGKYAIAAMVGDDLQIVSNSLYLSNPDIMAVTTKNYPGFYEGGLSSKKGMQGVHAYATEDLGIQAVLLNVRLNELIRTSTNVAKYGSACYVPYAYKGKTYYFHDMISYMKTIKGLNGWTDEYGNVHRNVSIHLLLGWDNELQYLIHPSARVAGKTYYTLNMAEGNARDTLEALFCYMAEKLGGSVLLPSEHSAYKYRVANWILGNEVNACRAWNYSGDISVKECADNYAQAFQILYQSVKRTDSGARVFISLDHDWNAGENGHGGKAFLDEFAFYMYTTAPHMRWNVDYHPYSQPLTRNDFWNDSSNTISDVNTRFISLKNLSVLTNYLGELEHKYFPQKGNEYIRVILGEQGFTASDKSQEALQAAAIGYGFYIASMNTRVDAYIIRAYKDDPAEGVMKQGVMYQNEVHKESYIVYSKLGTKDSIDCMDGYRYLVNENAFSWSQIVPGLRLEVLYR